MPEKYIPGLVSTIIPAFNVERYIYESVTSALTQTYQNIEIIVVDDGSTDRTPQILKTFGDKIIYLRKTNGGPASARNLGLSQASGEFVAFLDADDYWFKDKLNLQVDFIQRHPEYGMVHANHLILEKNKEPYPRYIFNKPPVGWIFSKLFLVNYMGNSTVMARRNVIDQAGGFDESSDIEDYELWLRMARISRIGFLDSLVGFYRLHDSNFWGPAKEIRGQLYVTNKFEKTILSSSPEMRRLIYKKRALIFYEWGCELIEHRKFEDAKRKFKSACQEPELWSHALIGLISCMVRSNLLFKSRRQALNDKHYAKHLMAAGDRRESKKYYRKSLRSYPMQKVFFSRAWL